MEKENTIKTKPIDVINNYSVDIIIPFHGQYKKLMDLINSINNFTYVPYNLCLVDDGSPNKDFIIQVEEKIKKTIKNYRYLRKLITIRNHEITGWASACKIGFSHTDSPLVCFLHSDCIISTQNWFYTLAYSLIQMESQKVGLVVPVTNNSCGGYPDQELPKSKMDDEIKIIEPGEYLTLYCFVCRRNLFDKCGGFIKEYPYGYYEEQEFQLRMQEYGYRQAICKKCWIYHYGFSTIKGLWRKNPRIRDIMEKENRQRCIADLSSISINR